jgi:carboxypeptidase Taq
MNSNENLRLIYDQLSELYRLRSIYALLDWDQQVNMPPKAIKDRADQLETMALLIHQKKTDTEFGRAIDELYEHIDSLSEPDQVNVRETKWELDIQRKLPDSFVAEKAQATTLGYNAWVDARPADDFKAVQPYLEKVIELCKRQVELIGYEEHPYDVFLDLFDPGSRTSAVKPVLLSLAGELKELIPSISKQFQGQKRLDGHYPEARQCELIHRVAQDLGFSFETGRIDRTAHPFMASMGSKDARIATRYYESDFISALYSTIHETGHALYDLGRSVEYAGTPMGESTSHSVHESQSRLWENLIGRSHEFIAYLSRLLPEYLPEAADIDESQLWKLINHVEPSLIRIEADEVTYSQHVVIRMLLEEALITDTLSVADLPDAWNDMYEKYLGIKPESNKNGVMQDVHWYIGLIGYFPTYALGNLYNAMMMEKISEVIPDLSQQVERGEFAPLLSWLRENVHIHGMHYRAPELIKRITGRDLSADAFVGYLKKKFLSQPLIAGRSSV